MKKNIFIILLLLIVTGIIGENVYADSSCPNSRKRELSNAAKYIKVDYEVVNNSSEKTIEINGDSSTYTVPNYYYNISIYNLTKDLYASVYRTKDEHSFSVNHEETVDNTFTFPDYDTTEIDNYTITIRPVNDCQGLTLRTIRFTKPKYNAYSEFKFCKNSSNFYCQKFVTKDLNISNTQEFLEKIQVNNEKNKTAKIEDPNEKIGEMLKHNWLFYVCIFLGIIIVALIAVLAIRKYNKDKRWKL